MRYKTLFLVSVAWLFSAAAGAAPTALNPDGKPGRPSLRFGLDYGPGATTYHSPLVYDLGGGYSAVGDYSLKRDAALNFSLGARLPLLPWLTLGADSASDSYLKNESNQFRYFDGNGVLVQTDPASQNLLTFQRFTTRAWIKAYLWRLAAPGRGVWQGPSLDSAPSWLPALSLGYCNLSYSDNTDSQNLQGSADGVLTGLEFRLPWGARLGSLLEGYFHFHAQSSPALDDPAYDIYGNAFNPSYTRDQFDCRPVWRVSFSMPLWPGGGNPDFGRDANPDGWLWVPRLELAHATSYWNAAPGLARDDLGLAWPLTALASAVLRASYFHPLSDNYFPTDLSTPGEDNTRWVFSLGARLYTDALEW